MTTRLHLDALDLDTLLLEDDAAGRNEAIESLQRLDDTMRENARYAAIDAEERAILRRWTEERALSCD